MCNVYSLHKVFNPGGLDNVYEQCTTATRGCVDCKSELAEAINQYLEPMRQKRREFEDRPDYVTEVLAQGAEKARAVARATIAEVSEKMGLA